MINSALFDVPCPHCGAGPLELCTVGNGRYMESTVHFPRRVLAGVSLVPEEPEPKTPRTPKARAPRPPRPRKVRTVRTRGSLTHCRNGHEYNEVNTYQYASGHKKCRICDADAKRESREAQGITPRGQATHCKRDHEYTPENTSTQPNGARSCRACKRVRDLASVNRKRAAK